MTYSATITYNETGKKLTNRNTYIMYIETQGKLDDKALTNRVYQEIPEMLIESIEFNTGGLIQLCAGDLVKVVTPYHKNGYTEISYVISKVIEVNDKGIKVEDQKYYFGFDGKEISRKKKDIPYIEFLTEDEIDEYNYDLERDELIRTLEDYIDSGYHYNFTNDELKDIIDRFN